MRALLDKILDPSVGSAVIAKELDAMSPRERRDALRTTTREEQRALYKKSEASPPVTLDDFVPASVGALTPVRHWGRNTLPLLPSWKFFSKVFARPKGGAGDRLFGYNDSPTGWLIGPGYYVAVPTKGNADWEARGAAVVDYYQVPDGEVPAGWPKVVPNSHGLQMFVYKGTRDFMRRVSEGVTIGVAYSGEKLLDHYFTLVRDS
jgi:hypothetical protein